MATSRSGASTRDRILDGAARVMAERGLAHTTTKEIARAAGYSEATLYKIFEDKVELFLCVLTERLPRIDLVSGDLADQVGGESVGQVLRRAGTQALEFYLASFPISASVFADAGLLTRHRDAVLARGSGPAGVVTAVAEYLRAEQSAGRVSPDARPDAVAAALIGACFQRAFLITFSGEEVGESEQAEFVADLVASLVPALGFAVEEPAGS